MLRRICRRVLSDVSAAEKSVVTAEKPAQALQTPTAAPTTSSPQPTTSSPPPPPRPRFQTVGGGWRSRMAAFFTGVAVTALYGYVKIHEDILDSAEKTSVKLSEMLTAVQTLQSRVEVLEKNTKY